MSKITNLLYEAGGNFARPTKYNVLISPPNGVFNITQKYLDVMCQSVSLPSIRMDTIDVKYKGHTTRIPGRVNQDQTLNISFYLDENHTLRQFFIDWIAAIDNRYYGKRTETSSSLFSYTINPGAGYGQIIVNANDFNEKNIVKSYLFENIYPVEVSGIEFNTAGTNEIMTFSVTFAFYRFINSGENFDGLDSFLDTFGFTSRSIGNTIGIYGGNNLIGTVFNTFNGIENLGFNLNNIF